MSVVNKMGPKTQLTEIQGLGDGAAIRRLFSE